MLNMLQNGLYTTVISPGANEIPLPFLLLFLIMGYLLGSINSAVLFSRLLYREDIRKKGSCNAGLTNMLRVYGKSAAILTLIGDILKTVIAILLTGLFFGFYYRTALSFSPLCYLVAIACVIGHIKPIYYGFRGGKGVLTAATAMLILCPPIALALIAIFVLLVATTKYVSLGSIVSAASLPLLLQGYMQAFVYKGEEEAFFEGGIVLFGLILGLIIVICHRQNIVRLWNHKENKLSFHSSSDKENTNGSKRS